jgi:hypothetical protein
VLGGRSFVAGIAIFVAVATNVYLAMVVPAAARLLPDEGRIVRRRSGRQPWRLRFDRVHRRSVRVLVLGWLAAAVALAAHP